MKKQITFGMMLSLISGLAFAHPGHGLASGFAAGFMHPLFGWDHLLMMLAIGMWAATTRGKARWQLPFTFVITMLLGALLGASGITLYGVESTIAAGLIALGMVLITRFELSPKLQLAFTALFALMHGLAHGIELSQGTDIALVPPLFGMVLATAILHAVGYGLGVQKNRLVTLSQSLLAGIMLGLGTNLLLTT